MNKDKANRLITEYINGWINGDAARVLNTLAPDCLIVESHGPRFEGRDEVEKWINDWNQDGSKVIEWEIKNKLLQDTNAAFQWYFRCIMKGREYKIDGAAPALWSFETGEFPLSLNICKRNPKPQKINEPDRRSRRKS